MIFIILKIFRALLRLQHTNACSSEEETLWNRRFWRLPLLVVLLVTAGCQLQGNKQDESEAQTITVYSARHYTADTALFDAFTKETGIKVIEVKGTAEELIQRLRDEGESTQADLFMTADGGVLQHAKENQLLQSFGSEVIRSNVSEHLRDPEDNWTAITTRARVIVYAKDRVSPGELSTYEDLADERWQGRLLVRSSSNLYNQSLLASMIITNGEEKSRQWAEGIVRNLARAPEGGDRSQAKAIAAGIGDIAIMNTYYIGQMSISQDAEEEKAAEHLGVFFPNQHTTGAHVNISGAGLVKHAKHKEQAIKLIEYMTGKEAQTLLSSKSFEYPVNEEAELPTLLQEWGEFKAQPYTFEQLYNHYNEVGDIFQSAGWK